MSITRFPGPCLLLLLLTAQVYGHQPYRWTNLVKQTVVHEATGKESSTITDYSCGDVSALCLLSLVLTIAVMCARKQY
jgi:hypothetical protein